MTGTATPLVAVLGATGYLGAAVTAAFAARPVRVRAVSRRAAPARAGVPVGDVEVQVADLADRGELAAAVAGADVVVHLLAHTRGPGTWRAADGDAVAERLNAGIVADLVAVLGAAAPADGTGTPPAVLFAGTAGIGPAGPDTAYERHKLEAERALFAATAAGVLRGVSLRLPTVFGHGPAGAGRGMVAAVAARALAGEAVSMWHDGRVRRHLLHVDDAAAAFVHAADGVDALAGRAWDVGSGDGVAVGEVLATVAEFAAARTGTPPVPVRTVPPPAHATPGDLRDVVLDGAPFRAATAWRPQVALDDGLRRTVLALAEGSARG